MAKIVKLLYCKICRSYHINAKYLPKINNIKGVINAKFGRKKTRCENLLLNLFCNFGRGVYKFVNAFALDFISLCRIRVCARRGGSSPVNKNLGEVEYYTT